MEWKVDVVSEDFSAQDGKAIMAIPLSERRPCGMGVYQGWKLLS